MEYYSRNKNEELNKSVMTSVEGGEKRPKMASLVLKAHDSKPRFNARSNCNFNLSQKQS